MQVKYNLEAFSFRIIFLEHIYMPFSPFSRYKLCIQNWWELFTKRLSGIYILFFGDHTVKIVLKVRLFFCLTF